MQYSIRYSMWYSIHLDHENLSSCTKRLKSCFIIPTSLNPPPSPQTPAPVSTLDELGVLDNTYVVFMSDNGFHIGSHALKWGKVRGGGVLHWQPSIQMRARCGEGESAMQQAPHSACPPPPQGYCFEEDVRVPFFMRGPGVTPSSVSNYQGTMVDVAPTIMALAGGRRLRLNRFFGV